MKKGMLKRILAGVMTFALVFMSVDAGCVTALAADLENPLVIHHNTGRADVEMVSVSIDVLDKVENSDYIKLDGTNYGSNYYDNEWEKYSTYYYYNQLPDDYKEVWDKLNKVCLSYLNTTVEADYIQFGDGTDGYYTSQVDMPEGTTKEDMKLFYDLFVMSNPQYYFVANGMIYAEDFSSIGLQVYQDFANGAERTAATELFKTKIDLAIETINQGITAEDKLLLAHDYIVDNVSYDKLIISDGYIDYDEEQAAYSQSAYSALCLNLTVCAGYSEAMQLLCNGVGIDTICVTSNDHQWNKVRMNDSWYNIDVTWGDQEYTDGSVATYYQYYARNDEFYETDEEDEHDSHIALALWEDRAPECTLDATPENAWTAPGTYPMISSTTATPIISAVSSTDGYSVTITSTTENAVIYYTVDGTEPSSAASKSYIYDEPFTVAEGTVVKAIAVCNEKLDSAVVNKKAIEEISLEVKIADIADQTYSGVAIEPILTITAGNASLEKGTDYTVEFKNNVNAGTASAEITFIGDYSEVEKVTKEFKIIPKTLTIANIAAIPDQKFASKNIEPELTITDGEYNLLEGTDYEVLFENNYSLTSEESKAKAVVTFKGNYDGEVTITFEIVARTLEDFTVEEVPKQQQYTGELIEPKPVIKDGAYTLVEGTDYILSYLSNYQVGTAKIQIVFLGVYNDLGTQEIEFEITPVQISSDKITVVDRDDDKIEAFIYTGEPIKLDNIIKVIVDGIYEDDVVGYEIVYVPEDGEENADNINAGKVTYKVILKGNYVGEYIGTFTIVPVDASELVIAPIANQTHTGEAIKPSLLILYNELVLEEGKDYTITYSNNIEVGDATGIVTFIGNYDGEAEVEFKIVEAEPEDITSDKVDINAETGYVSKITAGTTVADLLTALGDTQSVKIMKNDQEVKTEAFVGTGMTICVMKGTEVTKTYTIIVTGDTNGDGKISITDMIALKAHLLNKESLSGANAKAADVAGSTDGGDGKVSITDFIKVKAHLLNKETISGVAVK